MPPSFIKTIETLIYYQYAKIIATAAGKKEDRPFITKQVQLFILSLIHISEPTRP